MLASESKGAANDGNSLCEVWTEVNWKSCQIYEVSSKIFSFYTKFYIKHKSLNLDIFNSLDCSWYVR